MGYLSMAKIRKVVKENAGLLILAAIVGAMYLYLRTPGDTLATEAELAAVFSAGKPVLVELYSNT
ncbi:MAG: hypothetical protein QHH80_02450 [Anaerolineae bacterium]|jgi:hypothetical protein|nr:hypothetical protein [Anaerolineae bacterium]